MSQTPSTPSRFCLRNTISAVSRLRLGLLIPGASGCSFDRSGLADKLDCIDDTECAVGEVCSTGFCQDPATVRIDAGDPGDLTDAAVADQSADDSGVGDLGSDQSDDDLGDDDADVRQDAEDDLSSDADDGADLACDRGLVNACGGCNVLDVEIGGECGSGTFFCAGDDGVICDGDGTVNSCGGCDPLIGEPLDPCGVCGRYKCNVDAESFCADDGANQCDGCGCLAATPLRPVRIQG